MKQQILIAGLTLASCAPSNAAETQHVLFADDHGKCIVHINDSTLTLPLDAQGSAELRKALGGRTNEISLTGGEVPFHCIGSIMAEMQKVGGRVGFISEPPPSK